jgi:hypothetical protein
MSNMHQTHIENKTNAVSSSNSSNNASSSKFGEGRTGEGFFHNPIGYNNLLAVFEHWTFLFCITLSLRGKDREKIQLCTESNSRLVNMISSEMSSYIVMICIN